MLDTILHPSWQTNYFQSAFGDNSDEHKAAQGLLQPAFDTRKGKLHNGKTNLAGKTDSNNKDDDNDGFWAHQKRVQTCSENELCNYLESVDEPSNAVEKDPHLALEWLKVNTNLHLFPFILWLQANIDCLQHLFTRWMKQDTQCCRLRPEII